MSSIVPSQSPEGSLSERFIASGESVPLLVQGLDRAMQRGDVPVMRILSPLLMEIEERRGMSMSLARAYLKNESLPVFDALQTLRSGREISEALAEEIDDTFEDTAVHLGVLLKERASLPVGTSDYYSRVKKELTGGITELTTFALPNRNGRYLNFILIPSMDSEDNAGFDEDGNNLSFDFKAYPVNPITDLHTPVKLQMKTSEYFTSDYDPSILVVSLDQLTPNPSQAHDELPNAIVREGFGSSTLEDRILIAQTTLKLNALIWGHHQKITAAPAISQTAEDTPEEYGNWLPEELGYDVA